MSRNIFIETNAICPVCKNQFVLKYPNPKLYVAAGREADQRVTGYNWAQGMKTDEIPHYYAVLQCPQCLFADFRENLENPRPGPKENKLYEARRNLDFKNVVVLKKLRRLVSEEKMDLKSALSLHMSAVFSALLPSKEFIDQNKLGRLYLRLSWLYRELTGDTAEPEEFQIEQQAASASLEKLFKITEGMQSTINGMAGDIVEMKKTASIRSSEVGLEWDSEKNPYFAVANSLEHKLKEIQTLMEMLENSVNKDKKGDLKKPAELDISAIFANEETQQQLNEVASKWNDFPYSENYCLRRAIEAFDVSYKTEDAERSTEQSLAIVNLIVKLYLKVGDPNSALEYVTQMLKNGSREKQSLQTRLNQAKHSQNLSTFDEKNIMRKIATITTSVNQAMELRETILEMLFNKSKEKIASILKDNAEKSTEEQQAAIIAAGFSEGFIPYLRDRGAFKRDEESRKGWFSKKK